MKGRPDHATAQARALRVLALLQDSAVSFAEAGRRLGITRERVRQVASEYAGLTGRERQRRWRENVPERTFSAIASAIPMLAVLGYKLEVVKSRGAGDRSAVSNRQFDVNGHRCVTRRVFTPREVRQTCGPDAVILSPFRAAPRSDKPVEFVLYRLPAGYATKGWLIIPAQVAPMHSCVVKLGTAEGRLPAGVVDPERWKKYLNAWELLRGGNPRKNRTQAA